MKLLRTVRFDMSDDHVYDAAAAADEWAISGAFVFAHLEPEAITGKVKQGFSNGFLGLPSWGRSTFSAVSEATDADKENLTGALTRHFVEHYGAPNDTTARAAAEEEVAFVIELCADTLINTIFTVHRTFDDDGQIRESFRTIQPPTDKPLHSRIWSVVEDDD